MKLTTIPAAILLAILATATVAEHPGPLMHFDHAPDLLNLEHAYEPDTLSLSTSTVDDMPFASCLTVDVRKPGSSLYSVNLRFFHTNSWQAGESGLISFYCRSLDTQNRFGSSSLLLQYKPNYDDWRGHLQTDLFMKTEWMKVTLPFQVSIEARDTPECVLSFFLGGVDPHRFQIADLTISRFDTTVRKEDLPLYSAYYPGMEADAAWRIAAKQRIQQNRKANLTLKLVDADGNPLSGAKVHLNLKRHKFGFGAAIRTPLLISEDTPEEDRERYSDILTRTCSKITPTNAMKWRLHHAFKSYMPGVVAWAREHQMTLRGHLFIWPGFERLPEGYDLHKTDPDAFRQDLVDHIHTFANLYPDAFSEWDVMNEPYSETAFMDLLGKEVALDWFKAARAANPTYLNYINDFEILSGNNQEHQQTYFDWIRYLIDHDAPLDGIGFQGHYVAPMPPELILERINRFAVFGKKMQITEFDFKHDDPELQARFFEDYLTLIYSHPNMDALINWIFVEDDFRPKAALYRRADFSPTAMGKVWERLLTKEWHTSETLTTDERGEASLRGFKGIYEVEVGGQTRSVELFDDGTQQIQF